MQTKFFALVLAPVVMATVALTSTTAMAETKTVKVPFSFTVAGQTWPAGTYTLERNGTFSTVKLNGKDGARTFTAIANPSAIHADRVVLKFDQVNHAYSLQSMQYGSLQTTTLDRKMKKSETLGTQVEVGQ